MQQKKQSSCTETNQSDQSNMREVWEAGGETPPD